MLPRTRPLLLFDSLKQYTQRKGKKATAENLLFDLALRRGMMERGMTLSQLLTKAEEKSAVHIKAIPKQSKGPNRGQLRGAVWPMHTVQSVRYLAYSYHRALRRERESKSKLQTSLGRWVENMDKELTSNATSDGARKAGLALAARTHHARAKFLLPRHWAEPADRSTVVRR